MTKYWLVFKKSLKSEFPDSDIPMASAVKHRGAAGHQFPGYAAVRVD